MLGDKMYPYFEEYLHSVAEARRIEIEDVRAIRCVLDEEVATDRSIIETLIDLDRSVEGCPEWRDFLSETIADFVVWVEGPLGEVTAETSAWLIAALRGPSGVPAPSAASVVHAVITQAEETHSSLSLFALSTPCASSWTRPSTAAWERSADFVM
ncbi:hypothetical protein SAMN05444161_1225 [Rhizobiales bacterium GAS191]|jgi:hypothetical protein|nr:hypothetical protein SAMN05444161_1225 [Rhizobiales bacterium GAS191]